jgi:hypothetical protein
VAVDKESGPHQFGIRCAFRIGGAEFAAGVASERGDGHAPGDPEFRAQWINRKAGALKLGSLATGCRLGPFPALGSLELESVDLGIGKKRSWVRVASNFGTVTLEKRGTFELKTDSPDPEGTSYTLQAEPKDCGFLFSRLPLVGSLFDAQDGVELNWLRVGYEANGYSAGPEFGIKLSLRLAGQTHALESDTEPNPTPQKRGLTRIRGSEPPSPPTGSRTPAAVHWLDVNKSFKSVHIDKIGAAFDGESLVLYLNAGFSLSIMAADFYGLNLSFPLAAQAKFKCGLRGLALSFDKPPVTIAGGLYHVISKEYDDLYNGELILRFGQYGLSALASYCTINKNPSFFAYAVLKVPLGGPPFFFVNGLAFGLGVHRGLKLPTIAEVEKYPFVAAALGKSELSSKSTTNEVLEKLADWVPPTLGAYFLTAGISFNSCGLFDGFALLTAEFGSRLRFSLMGIAEVSLPPKVDRDKALAFIRLFLMVTVDPQAGVCELRGGLTEESHIFDRRCKLTGDFAVIVWFGSERRGDFFISLGGAHHPSFRNDDGTGKALYPTLAKVGINWVISQNLRLTANGYFALTPACMMAGADLDLSYTSGNLNAWLRAGAHFLVQWKPFFYEADVGIRVGASYTLRVWRFHKTFSVELGASLSIWGPEFSGVARVSWYVISFSVSFGNTPRNRPAKLAWDEFAKSFLPPVQAAGAPKLTDASLPPWPITTIHIADGLLGTLKEGSEEIAIVNGDKLKLVTASKMPCTSISWKEKKAGEGAKLGIVPMEVTAYGSDLQVELLRDNAPVSPDEFDWAPETGGFAPAIWRAFDRNRAVDCNDREILKQWCGVSISPKVGKKDALAPQSGTTPANFDFEPETVRFEWPTPIARTSGASHSSEKDDENEILARVSDTLKSNRKREGLVGSLASDFGLAKKVEIGELAERPRAYLLAAPRLRSLGSS